MARYRESACKQCRREGKKLFLKGLKCDTKCILDRKQVPPGQHGAARKKTSEYGMQLREKQKVRNSYGILERQFRHYYEKAVQMKGVTGTVMFQLLEARLDNIVYRSGLVPSRAQARQLVRHGHFLVNGQKVDVPSYRTQIGDLVSARQKSLELIKGFAETTTTPAPQWLDADKSNAVVKVLAKVEREDIDSTIKDALIVEYYSR